MNCCFQKTDPLFDFENELSQRYDTYFERIEKNKDEGLTNYLLVGLFSETCDNEPIHKGSLKKFQEKMVYKCIEELLVQRDAYALDVGCGLGGPLLFALKANPTLKIDGIDLFDKVLNRTAKLLSENHVEDRCDLLKMDSQKLSFESDRYDCVFALESLENMNQYRAFQEIFRVLKENGTLLFCEFYKKTSFNEEDARLLSEINITLIEKNDYLEFLHEIGFQNIQIINLTNQISPNFKFFFPNEKRFSKLIREEKIGYIKVSATAIKSKKTEDK